MINHVKLYKAPETEKARNQQYQQCTYYFGYIPSTRTGNILIKYILTPSKHQCHEPTLTLFSRWNKNPSREQNAGQKAKYLKGKYLNQDFAGFLLLTSAVSLREDTEQWSLHSMIQGNKNGILKKLLFAYLLSYYTNASKWIYIIQCKTKISI